MIRPALTHAAAAVAAALVLLLAGCGTTAPPADEPLAAVAAAAQACEAAAAEVRTLAQTPERPRACPRLPALRPGASLLERRMHTETIVRLYGECAGDAP